MRPNLPPEWENVELKFRFRGNLVDLKVGKEEVTVSVAEGGKVKVRTPREEAEVKPGETAVLEV
nr:glycosyl hydrolase family 65 protein [Thermococcus sp.]